MCCNKNFQKLDENLKKQYVNTCKYSNHDTNKFILLFEKGVCSYDYMDDWGISLSEKDFYSHLNKKNIMDADYTHGERACQDFKIKYLGKYHDQYVQSDTSVLGDVFENFRNMCLEIYELDPTHFLTAPRLAWQTDLKLVKEKLDL